MGVEASFSYVDPGAVCTDSLDGSVATVAHGIVNTQHTGVYTVTYRARDRYGNWNDADCVGSQEYVRTVTVVDTLKPVIALHYSQNVLGVSDATDTAVHSGEANPATGGIQDYINNNFLSGTELMANHAESSNVGLVTACVSL